MRPFEYELYLDANDFIDRSEFDRLPSNLYPMCYYENLILVQVFHSNDNPDDTQVFSGTEDITRLLTEYRRRSIESQLNEHLDDEYNDAMEYKADIEREERKDGSS